LGDQPATRPPLTGTGTQRDDYTVLLFAPRRWAEPVEFMYHCSTNCAIFLMSLEDLV
jgi:hypothetical protein